MSDTHNDAVSVARQSITGAVFGVLIYSNSFDGPFIFDDLVRIVKNPAIRRV